MREFHLQIVTPDGIVFDGDAEGILVRTDEGDVEILCGHTDFFATVKTGRAKLTVGGEEKNASASGGFISVKGGEVKLITTTFEFAEDIDLKRAEAARDRAEQALRTATGDKAILVAKAKLARAISRITVANLK